MLESSALRAAALHFYDRFTANDVASFDEVVSRDAKLFIGTADEEWFIEREKLRSGFAFDGLRLEPDDPQAWEQGDLGWVADRPVMHVPGIGALLTRFTAVFRREEGSWKLVMSHFSVGVPDSEVIDLQRRWLGNRRGR